LALAFEAMDHIEQTRKMAPGFTDLKLADGMYNYWRTVVTKSAPVLPDFGDHRQEGIAQMQEVEKTGVFLAPPATLSLAFTWAEEADHHAALVACLRNYREYPDNVINNLVLGSVHIANKKYDSALKVFDEILVDDPKNKRARYWRGLTLQQSGKLVEAEADYKAYLAFDYMEPYQRSQAHYRLGQVYYRQKKYAEAEAELQTSIKLDGNKGAKAQLDKMKAARKEGKITW
jgi:tetratricopeptide (TPR) repeat protein